MPRVCVVYFEMALLKLVKYQFTETTIVGYNFHLQQALRRKIQKPGIPAAELDSCMQLIDVLLLEIGVAYIQKNVLCDIRGRTNNYLERCNLHFNEQFANAHPNLFSFIAGIQKDKFDYTMQQEAFAVVQRCSNLMALALKNQLFQMDI
ncbi:hypothetical protein MXB_3611 [Myxobolus squamalis]|nr:hypothetical protein MXB_3611 [Myxobolus squamalis]